MACTILVAGYLGMNPPGFAAQVVALAFGLAASSIFPVLIMGIFNRHINKAGAIAGMLTGLFTTLIYILLQGLVVYSRHRNGRQCCRKLVAWDTA